MSTSDWIGTTLTLFGFGFTVWAFMLKKAIDALNHISQNLISIDKRLSALEHWKEYRDNEFDRYKKVHSLEL